MGHPEYRIQEMEKTAIEQAKWNLQQQQEEWAMKKAQADASGKLATRFLDMWGGAMQDVKSMFGGATKALENISGYLTGESGGAAGPSGVAKEQLGRLNEISDLIMGQYKDYTEQYTGLEKEFMESARGESAARGEFLQRLREEAIAKPGQAAARAGADVGVQGELARQAEARRLQSLGVDPTSGAFGALSRRSAIDLAGEKVKQMNLARRGERERAAGIALASAQVADPTKAGSMALGIRKAGTDILGEAAGVGKAAADVAARQSETETARLRAIGDVAGTMGGLASSYAQNIAKPYGELAGYYMGRSSSPVAIPSNVQYKTGVTWA
jgi:hypothetical protein